MSWLFLEWRRFLQKRLVGYDITLPQLSLLKELNKKEFLLPLEIADYLHCDRPTASVIIKNLEKKELICRKKDEKNSKFHRIYISGKGQDYIQMIDSSVPELTVSPFDVLTLEEKEQLLLLLNKCCNRMKEISEKNSKEEIADE